MAGFQRNIYIEQSREAVFDLATNPDRVHDVVPEIKTFDKLTEGPIGVGTRYHETRSVNGKEATVELEVVRFDQPVRYSVKNITEGVEVVYNFDFASEGLGTRVNLDCTVGARGLKKLLTPVVAKILEKEDGNHLERLKAAAERESA